MLDAITTNKDILIPILKSLNTKDLIQLSSASRSLSNNEVFWKVIAERFHLDSSKDIIIKFLNTLKDADIYFCSSRHKQRSIEHNHARCFPATQLQSIADTFKSHVWNPSALPETCKITLNEQGELEDWVIKGNLQPPLLIEKGPVNSAPCFFYQDTENLKDLPKIVSTSTFETTVNSIRKRIFSPPSKPLDFFSIVNKNDNKIVWKPLHELKNTYKNKQLNPQTEIGAIAQDPLVIFSKGTNAASHEIKKCPTYPDIESYF